jgi:hypothetical protein
MLSKINRYGNTNIFHNVKPNPIPREGFRQSTLGQSKISTLAGQRPCWPR